jgi:transcriptional regulator with XRE-family HTH domain
MRWRASLNGGEDAEETRIARLRIAEGLTLEELAEGKVDRDPRELALFERGGDVPEAAQVALARFFEVSVEHVMGWDEPYGRRGPMWGEAE